MPNTFKRNIVIGFGLSLSLLLLSSGASYISIRKLLSNAGWVTHTQNVIGKLEAINTLLLEAEANQRGFLLTGEERFLGNMQINVIQITRQIDDVKELTRDNERQQANVDQLSAGISRRLAILNQGIRMRREGVLVNNEMLIEGKKWMDQSRALIQNMENVEQGLLVQRTKSLQQFSDYTPILIILVAIISFISMLVFYGRIISDFRKRSALQNELVQKEAEVSRRLNIIRGIAEKVAQGNYTARVDDEGRDLLGELSGSLNKMSDSLNSSFTKLKEKQWLQTGVAGLANEMLGEQDIEPLAKNIVRFAASYTNSRIGALYLFDEIKYRLELVASLSTNDSLSRIVKLGEGIVGECAVQKSVIEITGINEKNFVLSAWAGSIAPATIIAVPLVHDGVLQAVLELGTVNNYEANHKTFLESVSGQAGIAINMSRSRRRLKELLEETQAQSEELQSQHSELENINEELKAQSQKLQVSEEELKVQQEELMQTNVELEERTTMLEEKNQLVEERNEEIQQKAAELALSTKYKSEFLANMSHELRTPLNSILLLSRLMVENNNDNLTADQIEYAQVIQSSGQGLLTLIDEILDLSKIEAGKMQMDFAETTVQEISNDLRGLFTPVAKQKNLVFSIDIATNVPPRVETDKMRLDQILRNLIANALKFTPKGSVTLNIYQDKKDPAMLVYAVKDTGIGIPQEKQRLIFEAFQQADGSTKRHFGGTGLGLSISRELARLLGGKIELSSTPGQGSEFRLTVPVSKADAVTHHGLPQEILEDELLRKMNYPVNRETPAAVLVTEDDTPGKMSEVFHRIENVLRKEPKKVLIVEENPVHAKALAYFLENFHIHPEIKNNVDEAVAILTEKDQSCVILDMGIQDEKSYQALEGIKRTPGLELLPIIVFTGKNLSPMQEGRLKQYVNSIVLKTAHSYQRILDEVSLFLHLTENKKHVEPGASFKKLGRLTEVLKGKKVLIADDDVRNIFSLSKALESYGMNIISAMDGREALDQLKKDPSIDIVLMDMMMPEMDGYESMSRIRSMPGFSKLPIIAVTAKAMTGDREKSINSGASDYITKPVDKDQLLSLLRVWLYDRI